MPAPYCDVCGRYSPRSSWNNSQTVGVTTYVACDFHSQAEFNGAVQIQLNPPNVNIINQDPSIDESPQE